MRPAIWQRLWWVSVVFVMVLAGVPRADVGSMAAKRLSTSHPSAGRVRLGRHSPDRPRRRIAAWAEGSWSWFADPRAVDVVEQYDQTYAGWMDPAGAITVGAFDPEFGVRRTHVVGYLFHDDHGSPAILVEPDKRLTVFWSAHNGSDMHYRTTLAPEDIGAWGPVQRVPSRLRGLLGFTYPNPVLLPDENNRLYLFWRGANWDADYATRAINGHWSRARELISSPGQRPYLKVDSNGSGTIALAFTDGHPRERTTSIYYAAYRAGWLRHANGLRIARIGAAPISPTQVDRVYNGPARGVSSWVWDVALDRRSRPVIVYATFPSTSNHAYWYARWDGRRWSSHFLTFAGPTISPGTIETEYSGGLALDHGDPSTVYLSRKAAGSFQIEKWSTPDGGSTWHHTTIVRTNGSDNIRPTLARGPRDGTMSLFWLHGHYGSYTEFRTSIDYFR